MRGMQQVIELQIILFVIMLVGFILTKMNVIKPEGRRCLTDLLIDIILPCNIVCSFMIKLDRGILQATMKVLLIALGIQVACCFLGKVLYPFAKESQKGVLRYATMCSNAGFMGNPVIEGIYGTQGLLFASIYLIPLRFFMWSAGLSCFTRTKLRDTVKKLALHPCIIAVWIGFFFLISQVEPPPLLYQILKYFSNCTLPVSILVIGSIMAGIQVKTIVTRMTLYFCGIRLLVLPLLTLAVCRILGINGLVTEVCVVLTGMPAGSTTAILADKYGQDAEYASKCVFISTLLSLLTIPLLIFIMEQ